LRAKFEAAALFPLFEERLSPSSLFARDAAFLPMVIANLPLMSSSGSRALIGMA
jgi:hypothetical protein